MPISPVNTEIEFDALLDTKVLPIIKELKENFPALFNILISIMLPEDKELNDLTFRSCFAAAPK